MTLSALGRAALHWLWPQTCAHCRTDLSADQAGPLCAACFPGLVPAEPPHCLRCAEPLREALEECRACAGRAFDCGLIRAGYQYLGPAVSLVHAFKFRGRRSAALAAGHWLALARPRFPELGRPDALVPVPLHRSRLSERGYNQALLIARGLSSASGLPVLEALRRAVATRPQWALGRRERLENLRGAFAPAARVKGLRLILIDDVCTSGASLEACAKTLREAGAAWVGGYVFARQAGARAT